MHIETPSLFVSAIPSSRARRPRGGEKKGKSVGGKGGREKKELVVSCKVMV